MKTRQAAIIGAGAIHTCHVEALSHVPDVALRALVDIDSDKGSRLAAGYGCQFYQDYREMLLDDAVDVVHICTPHHQHKPMILAALAAGKQVFCEKPMVMNPLTWRKSSPPPLSPSVTSASVIKTVSTPPVWPSPAALRKTRLARCAQLKRC